MLWADSASSGTFGGHKEFQNFVTKSQIQEKLGRTDDASQTLKKGMQVATIQELNQYGRRLLSQKKNKEAMELFKFNLEKNPNKFAPLVGMARGYSADGDFKTALKYAKMAEPLAPDEANKKNIVAIIEKLKAGKDIN